MSRVHSVPDFYTVPDGAKQWLLLNNGYPSFKDCTESIIHTFFCVHVSTPASLGGDVQSELAPYKLNALSIACLYLQSPR